MKKTMSNHKKEDYQNPVQSNFDIDNDDIKILHLIQETPDITHIEIGKRINKSQPAVGARITKLERKNILHTRKGVNFKPIIEEHKLFLLMVDLQTKNPEPIMDELTNCPFILNAFKKTGKFNISLMIASPRLENLEEIIDSHFRSNPAIMSVETSIVVDVMRDFTVPVNWEGLKNSHIPCEHLEAHAFRYDYNPAQFSKELLAE
jgi:DNA-binding Lrp family transcriptional regulator